MKTITQTSKSLVWLVLSAILTILSYASCSNANAQAFLYSSESNSPLSDARPGQYFFDLAVQNISKNDYRYAVMLYKVAASWAYKPAEYNLGVVFVKGEGGVPEDHLQGLAWLTLAAERGDKQYVAARDRVRGALPPSEVAQADAIAVELSKTYGDEHALPRAKLRWRGVRNNPTGSHVGFVSNLKVGAMNVASNSNPRGSKASGRLGTNGGISGQAAGLTGGNYVDGSIAYRDLRESDNPYDPKFDVSTVIVGEVQTAGSKEDKKQDPPTDVLKQ
jgi:TPR repeat protein